MNLYFKRLPKRKKKVLLLHSTSCDYVCLLAYNKFQQPLLPCNCCLPILAVQHNCMQYSLKEHTMACNVSKFSLTTTNQGIKVGRTVWFPAIGHPCEGQTWRLLDPTSAFRCKVGVNVSRAGGIEAALTLHLHARSEMGKKGSLVCRLAQVSRCGKLH